VHDIQFFEAEDGLDIAFFRNKSSTGQLRRYKYGNLFKKEVIDMPKEKPGRSR